MGRRSWRGVEAGEKPLGSRAWRTGDVAVKRRHTELEGGSRWKELVLEDETLASVFLFKRLRTSREAEDSREVGGPGSSMNTGWALGGLEHEPTYVVPA